jgi:hypothetical protein
MEKLKSLYRLDSLNLNTPEILHYQGPEPTEADILRVSHLLQSMKGKRISIRTEKEGEFKSPFLPNALVPDAREFLLRLVGKGYHILITKGVPTNSIVRGNCVPNSSSNYFEYLTGIGTVRDIDESGRNPKNLTLVWGQFPNQLGGVVGSALQMVNSFLFPRRFDFTNEIVEFSVFSKGVGVKQDKVIFWEVRKYGGSARV